MICNDQLSPYCPFRTNLSFFSAAWYVTISCPFKDKLKSFFAARYAVLFRTNSFFSRYMKCDDQLSFLGQQSFTNPLVDSGFTALHANHLVDHSGFKPTRHTDCLPTFIHSLLCVLPCAYSERVDYKPSVVTDVLTKTAPKRHPVTMAVFGLQMIFSLVAFTFLQKLSRYYSFGRWILSNRLVRYLHPTNEELKTAAGIPLGVSASTRVKHRREHRRNNQEKIQAESFTVPRNIPITLETAKVEPNDLLPLHYFGEFQWLMDFSLCALFVYVSTEIYYGFFLRTEPNISILWCLLVLGFCFRVLFMQTSVYFQTEDGGERILCITFGFFFLVAAMGVLVVSENNLEFGLEQGYNNFSNNAVEFLKQQGIASHGPISLLTFKIILAFVCAFLGAFVTFPGLRLASAIPSSSSYFGLSRWPGI
ncbi:Transmembrane protein 161B,Transmembrane protein 161A [Acanthosepion pharaonis]|uniref:Transmembrane protein 161B,Transmembrane protein 161A n=1 Tax=Acanthosepion pharaonis TaxID=158019 RepID=A0A812C2Y9_ACAPH|nr:Transmembrane protein 161B,Transmembrane protein 161A [Sepia pharaonis]